MPLNARNVKAEAAGNPSAPEACGTLPHRLTGPGPATSPALWITETPPRPEAGILDAQTMSSEPRPTEQQPPAQEPPKAPGLLRSSGVVGITTMLSRVLGRVRDTGIARQFVRAARAGSC